MSGAGLPSRLTPLPGHAQVTYCGLVDGTGCYTVHYRGLPDALVASGAATASIVARGIKGKRRRTDSGHRIHRTSADAKGRITIVYQKLPCQVAEGVLPGVPRTWRSAILPALRLTDPVTDPDFAPAGDDS